MALSAIAAGATTTEVRVAGLSGGLSASAGLRSGGAGASHNTAATAGDQHEHDDHRPEQDLAHCRS